MTPLAISVLLPVHFQDVSAQRLRWLRRGLESILDQRFPDAMEILVIDDGSPVPLAGAAADLGAAASSVRWLRLDINRGLAEALNFGLRHARYPLIARIDADDRWCAGKIEAQAALFAGDEDLTITATGMTRRRPDGSLVDVHVRPGSWQGVLAFVPAVGCPFPHGSVLARRDIYLLLGGYPQDADMRYCEDFALWGTWLRFFKPAMIERALYDHTLSPSSVSAMHRRAQLAATDVIRRRFARLGLASVLPRAVPAFAERLGVSVIQAGILCYRLWHHQGLAVRLPEPALAPLQEILPDRDLVPSGPQAEAAGWRELLGMPPAVDRVATLAVVARPSG